MSPSSHAAPPAKASPTADTPIAETPAVDRVASDRAASDQAVADLHALVLASLDDDQAIELVTIPLAGKSSIADHMVIASGRSTRHVAAMANKLAERIKREGKRKVRIEGLPTADWVLVDADDVIIHLFRPEVRSFYNLERMWQVEDAPAASAH